MLDKVVLLRGMSNGTFHAGDGLEKVAENNANTNLVKKLL